MRTGSAWVGVTAGLSLAFAPLFWSQALITEVYSSAAFFIALALVLIESKRWTFPWRARLAGMALGLAIAVHPVAIVAAIYFLSTAPDRMFGLGVGMLVGGIFYVTIPMMSYPWPQPWGDLSTFDGWWAYVSAQMYRHYVFGLPLRHWPQRSLSWFVSLLRQVTPLGGVLTVLGTGRSFENHTSATGGIWASVAVVALISIGYNTADSLVYLVPILPLVMLLFAYGVGALNRWAIPAWVGLIVPILLLVTNWQALDLSNDGLAVDWVRDTLGAFPNRAAALTRSDRHTFGLWYATEALGERSDIVVIDLRLWHQMPYRRYLASTTGMSLRRLDDMGDLTPHRPLCEVKTKGTQCR